MRLVASTGKGSRSEYARVGFSVAGTLADNNKARTVKNISGLMV
jgi:hypothetical protein